MGSIPAGGAAFIDIGVSDMIHFCYIMKSKSNLLEQLKSLPHFGKNTVCQFGKQLGLKDSTVNVYISRFLKYKNIIQLKRGLYVSTDFLIKTEMMFLIHFILPT